MLNSPRDYPVGYTKDLPNFTSRKISLVTFLSKQLLPAIFPVIIVRVRKFARIWTTNSSGKLLTRLVDTDLEALAYTFSENRSYTRAFLRLLDTSKGGINAMLFSSQQTEQKLTSVSMTLYPAGLTKRTGLGGKKQDLTETPY